MTTTTIDAVIDNLGNEVHPNNCSHAYGYDGSGRLITDTMTNRNNTITWVKTYTYDGNGRLTAESLWIKQ